MKPFRKVAGLGIAAVLLGSVPAAHADLYSGTCLLRMKFTFKTAIGTTSTDPNYKLHVTQPGNYDLDETWPGNQTCAVSLSGSNPVRSTAIEASGRSSLWSCSSVVAFGTWEQEWRTRSNFPHPEPVFGTYQIDGSWNNWTFVITNPSLRFIGVIEANLAENVAQHEKLLECESGGLKTLIMKGVMYFQDP